MKQIRKGNRISDSVQDKGHHARTQRASGIINFRILFSVPSKIQKSGRAEKKVRNHEKGVEVTVTGLLRRGAKDIVRAGFSGCLGGVAAEGQVVVARAEVVLLAGSKAVLREARACSSDTTVPRCRIGLNLVST